MHKARTHSVTLQPEKCEGCTNCIKRCPTEAIRVRDSRARITAERCIDCGECIRVCPYHAKVAVSDPLEDMKRFKHTIALPAPALYGQFKGLDDINRVLEGLLALGFNDVFEVARAAEYVSVAVKRRKEERKNRYPVISAACPVIVRLIQVRFPDLIDNIVDIESPMEAAGLIAKREYCERTGADITDVGAFFITPCAAKMTAVHNPLTREFSAVDGAISILDVYGALSSQVKDARVERRPVSLQKARAYGVGWANSGGETSAMGVDASLAVDGIWNVIHALDELENGKFSGLEFFEGLACTGGCVGGPLAFENPFVAKNRLRRLIEKLPKTPPEETVAKEDFARYDLNAQLEILPNNVLRLDDNIVVALEKMGRIDEQQKRLPGLDCGSCGSPSCRALAEDIVRGEASEMNCIFKLKEKVRELAQQMVDLGNTTRM